MLYTLIPQCVLSPMYTCVINKEVKKTKKPRKVRLTIADSATGGGRHYCTHTSLMADNKEAAQCPALSDHQLCGKRAWLKGCVNVWVRVWCVLVKEAGKREEGETDSRSRDRERRAAVAMDTESACTDVSR